MNGEGSALTATTPTATEQTEGDEPTSDPQSGWQLIWTEILATKTGILLGMFAALAWTAGRVAIPIFVQLGIDRGLEGGRSLTGWALLIVAAGIVSAAFFSLRRYTAFNNGRVVETRVRDRLFAHIQRLHFAYHDTTATGELMSRCNTDLQHFQNVITLVPITTGNLLTVIAVTIIMIILEPLLAVLALLGLPFVNILGRRFAQQLQPALLSIQVESAELATVVEETVAGVRVVKGFGAEPAQAAKLGREADDVYGASMRASTIRSRFLPAMELLPNIGLITVLAYGGHLVLDGQMTVGELASFNIFVIMLVAPLRMLGMVVANAQRAATAGRRIAEVLETAPEIVDSDDPVPLPASGALGRVEFRDVDFDYHAEANAGVLEGLSLTIEPGESVALVGATASGKSTIARLIPRFYEVDGGAVLLDGIDVRDIRRAELRRSVGVVFQDTFLFSSTIRDNIAYADPDASMDDVRRAAKLAGAHAFISELVDGYDTAIGERGFSLSGGQRQRIAIARAILADPRVLILDDATSAVDPTKEHEIRDALDQAMQRRTTIVIAHRPSTIALADRVVLLDEGRIVAEGTHNDLLTSNERYRTVLAASEGEG